MLTSLLFEVRDVFKIWNKALYLKLKIGEGGADVKGGSCEGSKFGGGEFEEFSTGKGGKSKGISLSYSGSEFYNFNLN